MIVHTTGRNAYKSCQQRWYYSDVLGLESKLMPHYLWFGTAWHAALAEYYRPESYRDGQNLTRAAAVFDAWCAAHVAELIGANPNEEDVLRHKEFVDLGLGMLEQYNGWVWPQNEALLLEPIFVEKTFAPRLKPRSPHRCSFTPDAIFRDGVGRWWIGEWKTAETIHESDEWLAMDEQVGSYALFAQRELAVLIEGVIYDTARKKIPKPLRVLASGRISSDVRQDTTFEIASRQLVEFYGTPENVPVGHYEALLTKLRERNNFFKRVRVRRNQNELSILASEIEREVAAMARTARKPETLTRTPSRFNCSTCAFREPCMARWEGNTDGEASLLDALYKHKEAR
jgi:PD-(D/E)XK nuclease superfamily